MKLQSIPITPTSLTGRSVTNLVVPPAMGNRTHLFFTTYFYQPLDRTVTQPEGYCYDD